MYVRRHGKNVDGEEYGYWSLVESVRTARGPRQRIVATIGKLPGLDKEERIGWEEISRIFTGKPRHQDSLLEKTEEPPAWATMDINRVSVERLRSFGDIYLALLLWQRLGFSGFCREHMPEGRETIPYGKARSWYAANLPSEKRQNTSTYSGLLPCTIDVADTSAMDEGIRAWHSTEKTY